MYNIEELNAKLLSELRPIADEFGIRDNAKFQKKELIYEILKKQSVMPGPDLVEGTTPVVAEEAPRRGRRPKAAPVSAETTAPPAAPAPADSIFATNPVPDGPDSPRTRQRVRRDAGAADIPPPTPEDGMTTPDETPAAETQPGTFPTDTQPLPTDAPPANGTIEETPRLRTEREPNQRTDANRLQRPIRPTGNQPAGRDGVNGRQRPDANRDGGQPRRDRIDRPREGGEPFNRPGPVGQRPRTQRVVSDETGLNYGGSPDEEFLTPTVVSDDNAANMQSAENVVTAPAAEPDAQPADAPDGQQQAGQPQSDQPQSEQPAQPQLHQPTREAQEYQNRIRRQYNQHIREFDGIIDNEGVLEIM